VIPFVSPSSGNPLCRVGQELVDGVTGERVAAIENGIPRFVPAGEDYAESFGWQWHRWHSTLSDARNEHAQGAKHDLVLRRTRFDTFELEGKSILECGMGGGDDTEVLLDLPFAEVHAFDLSRAVDRAVKYLSSERLVLSQASIFAIPYADHGFDFVFCHRVLQHTPDPEAALRAVARKVKLGGVLFVHSYHKSFHFMSQYKYKLRPITRRLPVTWVAGALDRFGPRLHRINRTLRALGPPGRLLAHNFVPFQHLSSFGDHDEASLVEVEKLLTFDALTPRYDLPMRWPVMKSIVESEGFEVRFYQAEPTYPLYCTAQRVALRGARG
jgi:2-polyprenyl-3-methyl-5-hydroxy-6-metoxy-1,4-benzoquinol methylase